MKARAGGWWLNKVNIDQVAEEDLSPLADALHELGGTAARDIWRGFMLLCLPGTAHYGGQRRWSAGYVRFCAFAWHCCRDLTEAKSQEDFAEWLGIDRSTFSKQVTWVERLLAGEHPGQMHLPGVDGARVLPTENAQTGSARARGSRVRHVSGAK